MTALRASTARDELGVIFLAVLFAAFLLLLVPFIGAHAPAAPAPRDITVATAAPAVIFQGPR